MSDENFKLAVTFTMKWEGGYNNDPLDPGGETNFGISKRAYPDVDIKSLTKEEAEHIYKRDYWDKMNCDSLPVPLAIAVFDSAVNCGVGRTKSWLTEMKETDDARKARWFIQRRIAYYLDLVKKKPAFTKYIKGWLNRTNDLSKYIDILK